MTSNAKTGNSALAGIRDSLSDGDITATTRFGPGLVLRADPALGIGGRFRSPAGRILELDITTTGPGDWIGLHVGLDSPDLSGAGFIGFACRSAAPEMVMIQPCLRSARDGDPGFGDSFFDRHILARPDPATHADALHVATTPDLPGRAPWRELILFLPTTGGRWHLHDLRLFCP